MKINHVHLNSPNVTKTAEFYQKYFGFRKKEPVSDEPTFLVDKDGFLMAVSPLESAIEFPSWFHIGFAKRQPDEVRDLYRRMQTDGVPLTRDLIDEEDATVFWCRDPSGYKVEVSSFKANFESWADAKS